MSEVATDMDVDASFDAGQAGQTAEEHRSPSGPQQRTSSETDTPATTVTAVDDGHGSGSDNPTATVDLGTNVVVTATTMQLAEAEAVRGAAGGGGGAAAAAGGRASPKQQLKIGDKLAHKYSESVKPLKKIHHPNSSREWTQHMLDFTKVKGDSEFQLRLTLNISLNQANEGDGVPVEVSSIQVTKLQNVGPSACHDMIVAALVAMTTFIKVKFPKVHKLDISGAELESESGDDSINQTQFLPRKFILSLQRPDHRHCSYPSSFPNSFTFHQICATTTRARARI